MLSYHSYFPRHPLLPPSATQHLRCTYPVTYPPTHPDPTHKDKPCAASSPLAAPASSPSPPCPCLPLRDSTCASNPSSTPSPRPNTHGDTPCAASSPSDAPASSPSSPSSGSATVALYIAAHAHVFLLVLSWAIRAFRTSLMLLVAPNSAGRTYSPTPGSTLANGGSILVAQSAAAALDGQASGQAGKQAGREARELSRHNHTW